MSNSMPDDVDDFLLDLLNRTSDTILQSNVLDALIFRTKEFKYAIGISKFEDFIEQSLEKIYKYNAAIVIFKESYDPSKDDEHYEKRFYPLLIDELKFRTGLLLKNIFEAFRIAYPDDRAKKFFFKKYYHDLLSTDRVKKDNATTVLEQILPRDLYVGMYNLFEIEDFENTNRDKDFKRAAQERYSGFDLSEEGLLASLKEEEDDWLLKIIVDYGERKGDKNMLERMDRVNFLKSTDVFKDVSGEVLYLIAEKAKEKIYPRGEYVLKEGDVVDSLYVIYKGEVEILVGDESVAVLGAKEVLGEMEIFREDQDRYAVTSVRVKSDEVVSIRIRKNDFDEVFDANIELARALIRSLGERVERMNERVRGMEG